jgi:hypothetical protein
VTAAEIEPAFTCGVGNNGAAEIAALITRYDGTAYRLELAAHNRTEGSSCIVGGEGFLQFSLIDNEYSKFFRSSPQIGPQTGLRTCWGMPV